MIMIIGFFCDRSIILSFAKWSFVYYALFFPLYFLLFRSS